ncbi:F-box only protein 21 isoform X1 [Pungitius pungitius]|uniref:F-box only protein 21 isoform X1 n=1 Tax=Pungitius pungitius TaxID=134920 RepID=UPI002E0EBEE1
MATFVVEEGQQSLNGIISDTQTKKLTDLPTELLEHILCFPVLKHDDVCNVSCCCKRLHDVCHGRGKVWGHQYKLRWPRLQMFYRQNECCDWLREYKTRHRVGIQIRRTVESISRRFFTEVPCVGQVLGDSFAEIESLGMPEHFCEDELLFILHSEKRKSLTLKYYAKKILYFLRQQNILRSLKTFMEQPADQQSSLEGAVLVDQYCNPLADVTLNSVSAQLDEIAEKVKKMLRIKNPSHPSLRIAQGDCSVVQDFELQRQVVCALNSVLYEQLQYKGNEFDYYNPLNSYIHQVLLRRTGIPISLSVLYINLTRKLGVQLEPVNFPNHFLLRWCQKPKGSEDIYDFVYIDAFGKGKQLTAKECEYLIGHQVTADYYSAISTTEVLLRMVGNLLNIGKRGEGNEKSYQLLRDSLDLYLTINPDNVQYLLLQARLYFHLGIWPEKVLDILQHIQALDPSQHGAVGYLVQHTLEHIQHKKHPATPEVKKRSAPEHLEVRIQLRDLRLGPKVHHEPGVDHHHEGPPAVQRRQPAFLQRPRAGRHVPLRSTREPGAARGAPGDRPPGGGALLLRVRQHLLLRQRGAADAIPGGRRGNPGRRAGAVHEPGPKPPAGRRARVAATHRPGRPPILDSRGPR